jgi:pyruvate dehydrogenase E1 component beta subunit
VVEELGAEGKAVLARRLGFAPTTCPTTPALEQEFYPDPVKIAQMAYAMVRPGAAPWHPDPEQAKLAYQAKFRGPF